MVSRSFTPRMSRANPSGDTEPLLVVLRVVSAEDVDKILYPLGYFLSKDDPKDVVSFDLLLVLHTLISFDSMKKPWRPSRARAGLIRMPTTTTARPSTASPRPALTLMMLRMSSTTLT